MRLVRFLFRKARAEAPPDRFDLRLAALCAAEGGSTRFRGTLFASVRRKRSLRAA